MKKICSILLVALLILSLSVTASAQKTYPPSVVDNAGLLSDGEISALEWEIQELRDSLELDIVIVTTYGTGYKTIQAFADDFYDENGYGYGEKNNKK